MTVSLFGMSRLDSLGLNFTTDVCITDEYFVQINKDHHKIKSNRGHNRGMLSKNMFNVKNLEFERSLRRRIAADQSF